MFASSRFQLAALICVLLAACSSADDAAPRATTSDAAAAVAMLASQGVQAAQVGSIVARASVDAPTVVV